MPPPQFTDPLAVRSRRRSCGVLCQERGGELPEAFGIGGVEGVWCHAGVVRSAGVHDAGFVDVLDIASAEAFQLG
jgi:hypothetical protein